MSSANYRNSIRYLHARRRTSGGDNFAAALLGGSGPHKGTTNTSLLGSERNRYWSNSCSLLLRRRSSDRDARISAAGFHSGASGGSVDTYSPAARPGFGGRAVA